MIKLMLNNHKFNNYAFFCPVSRLHLTVSNPVGYVNEVTTAILRGLKSQNIIDVDNVIDIETGTIKAEKTNNTKQAEAPKQEKVAESKSTDSKKENDGNSEQVDKAVKESKTETPAESKSKRGKRATAPVLDETDTK